MNSTSHGIVRCKHQGPIVPERLEYLQIHRPGDTQSIRRFVEKHKPLGIEGYERMPDKLGALCFMLGYEDERTKKPVFVAGVRTEIWEFAEVIETALRRALKMSPDRSES